MEERDDEAPIKSVRKAMDILDVLCEARRPLRISDISARLNMSVSAVSRLIATLSKRALIELDEDSGRCYLGLGLTVLGASAVGRRNLDRIALPVMDELANRVQAYVGLGRLSRGKVVIMRALHTPLNQHGVNMIVVAPTHTCAPGKLLCGALTPAEITAMLAAQGMDPITPHTITEPVKFLQAVEAARADGFAIDNQESAYEIRHVACPIFDHDGRVTATLSAGGELSSLPWREIPGLIQALSHSCLRISREFGYTGNSIVNIASFDESRYEAALS
jgi:IclR family transcriptional regulator, KDG regulon repressor